MSPFTPRLTPTTSRIVSVNMDYPGAPGVGGQNEEGQEGEGGLDMELMHNFGEGVGVDMRDFTVNDEGDEVVDVLGDAMPKSGEWGTEE